MKRPYKTLNIPVSDELHAKVKDAARRDDRTISGFMRIAAQDRIQRLEERRR